MPKVSAIMPAYNAEKYIKEAIESILSQTFGDFEFIIINDCSKDATEEIILSYTDPRVVYIKNDENLRVARTLNKGLEIAQGEYIARMDADDISLPDRFEKQVKYLDTHPEVAVLGTNVEVFDEDGPICTGWSSTDPAQMKVDLFFSCGLAHPSVMMRKNVIRELGGYDAQYEGLEDYQLWCRVAEKYGVTTLPELLFRYRIHGGQVTKNPSPEYLSRMRRLKEWQLSQLGLSMETTGAELFCNGKQPETEAEILTTADFYAMVMDANKKKESYDPTLLRSAFQSVLMASATKLDGTERKTVCRSTELISSAGLSVYRLKRWLRKALRR